MYQLSLKIKTLTPVILAQSSGENIMATTEDFFPGTAVRGLLAEKYIQDKQLKSAEQDDVFYKLFLSGDVSFGPAYYALSGIGVCYPLPLSLTHDKDKKNICDLALKPEGESGYKGMKGFGHINEEGKVSTASVKKNLELHMSRQGDEERIIGSSQDGQMYNYEALSADQNFESLIIGEKEDLEKLFAAFADLRDGAIMYIGRSKHTQYGKCEVQFGDIKPCKSENSNDKIAIKFTTDFLPENECFSSAEQAVADCFQNVGIDSNIDSIFSSVGEQEGFVGIWGLKRSARRSLKAGTVVVLQKDSWTDEELNIVCNLGWKGCGERCIDGFGRFELYDVGLKKQFAEDVSVQEDNHMIKPSQYSKAVKDVVEKIIDAYITEKLQNIGAEDIENRKTKKRGSKHLFARMEEVCKDRESVKNEIRPHSSADKMLNGLIFKGISLKEILDGQAAAPYQEQWQDVITEDMKNLADTVGVPLPDKDEEKVFKIYWQWYWRMARKNPKGEEVQK